MLTLERGTPGTGGKPITLRIVWTWLRHALVQASRSLAGRLMYTLAALAVLLLILQAEEHRGRLNERLVLLTAGQSRAASVGADVLHRSLNQLHHSQQMLGHAIFGSRVPAPQMAGLTREVKEEYPGMISVELIEPDGTIRWAYPSPGFKNSFAGEPFLESLKNSERSLIYLPPGAEAGPEESGKFRVSSRVVNTEGQPLGSVSMQFEAASLSEFLPAQGEDRITAVLDDAGRLVFPADGPAQALAAALPAIRRSAAVGAPFEVTLPGSGLWIAAPSPVPTSGGWSAVSMRQEAGLLSSVDRDTRMALLATLAVVMALGVGMVAVLRVSLRPLDRLSAAAIRLGVDARRRSVGDFSLPPLSAEVREFERLANAFNTLSEDLQATHTQLFEAQQRLERANTELQERVRARELELEGEHQKLLRAERLSTLGLLSSAIAHDLRNPLNTVGLGVYWLKARLAAAQDERANTRLDAIASEVRRAEQIIRTLLAFARTGEPERQPVDVNELAREVVHIVEPAPEFAVNVEPDPDLPEIHVDRPQLFQVLENLIRNAMQAMPEGGVITVTTLGQAERVQIRISDTGPGIAEEVQATIFEPLVTTRTTGTGLGLALCKRIVDAHGGTIDLQSRPGEGAVFVIELPVGVPAE